MTLTKNDIQPVVGFISTINDQCWKHVVNYVSYAGWSSVNDQVDEHLWINIKLQVYNQVKYQIIDYNRGKVN